jgi:hypothetical protein
MMGRLGSLCGVLALGASLAACEPPEPATLAAPEGDWIQLFNGRDLEDWTPKFTGYPLGENARDTFRVEDGILVVSYEKHDSWDNLYGHLFYKVRPFSHYWIRAEYRFVGDQVPGAPDWAWRNNGLMLHSQPPETMTLNQEWPISIEVRLMGGGMFGERPTADLCLIDTTAVFKGERIDVRVTDSDSRTYRGDQWVTVEAEVRGGEIVRYYVNGEQVMEFSEVQLAQEQPWSPTIALESGYIAIQAESHPTEFRRIEVLEIES